MRPDVSKKEMKTLKTVAARPGLGACASPFNTDQQPHQKEKVSQRSGKIIQGRKNKYILWNFLFRPQIIF